MSGKLYVPTRATGDSGDALKLSVVYVDFVQFLRRAREIRVENENSSLFMGEYK